MMSSPPPIRRNDVILAIVCGVVAIVLLIPISDLPWERHAALVAVGGVQGIVVVWWRRHPVVCQLLVWGLQLVIMALLPETSHFMMLAQAVAGFGIGLRLPLPRGVVLMGLLALGEMLAHVVRDVLHLGWTEAILGPTGGIMLITVMLSKLSLYLGPVFGGAMSAARTQRVQQQRDWEAREHQHQLDLVLIDERRRIAGELHDVAAHHLAGIVVQSQVVGRLIDRDPAAAKQAAAQLKSQSRETLNGLRSVVGLLRRNTAPVAGLRDLPELVSTTRDLGVDATLTLSAARIALPPVADMAVYRVAQQAISNALQHAPGAWLRVDVGQVAGQLEMTIVNGPSERPGDSGSGGNGLNVMRERAATAGGTLDAGPTPEGGWRVRLAVPVVAEEER
ncbi:sensor histidine kinase [[Pseudopropionibacterium] massiliense]|uniref:sensor histidine kinase n=1 Tax=[Pseudopropionibacterium] massiliense TaxID=2220000 RepID=UPI001030D360|nr:histidine kinase [[Pseudopropionibacterium] massiliense]